MFYKTSIPEVPYGRRPMKKHSKRDLNPHSGRILREIEETGQLISSRLLELETRRPQIRLGDVWGPYQNELLRVELVEVEPQDFNVAFDTDVHTKSLDALPLASCVKVGANTLITADKDMRDVAEHLGIEVLWAG